jgi:hypothetical protein
MREFEVTLRRTWIKEHKVHVWAENDLDAGDIAERNSSCIEWGNTVLEELDEEVMDVTEVTREQSTEVS